MIASSGACVYCRVSLPEERDFVCDKCDSYVSRMQAEYDAQKANEAASRRLRESGLPALYQDGRRGLSDLPPECVIASKLDRLGRHSEKLGKVVQGLYLYGPPGGFKTTVACAYLAAQIKDDHTGVYAFVPDLMREVHAGYEASDGGDPVRRCSAAQLLVLDDLGKEKASEHAAGVVLRILDWRMRNYRDGQWTIVTSNFDLDALCDRFPTEEFSEPIRRRLAEMTVCVEMCAAGKKE